MLEEAKINIRNYFSVIGLTERFDESLVLMRRTLGWRQLLYSQRLVNKARPKKESLSSDTVNLIAKHNALDMQLYEYVSRLLDDLISDQGRDFQDELKSFRVLNERHTRRYGHGNGSL